MAQTKRIVAAALAGLTVVSTTNPGVLLVSAESRTNDKTQLSITSGATGIHLTTADIQLFKDAGRTIPVAFTLSNEDGKDYINITSPHDSEDVFYYRLTNANSKTIEGQFKFPNVISENFVSSTEVGKKVSFRFNTGNVITSSDIQFTDKAGNALSIPYADGSFDFSGQEMNKIIKYRLNTSDSPEAEGEFVLTNVDTIKTLARYQKVDMPVVKHDQEKVYGDEKFAKNTLVDIPADYTGSITYTVVSGNSVSINGNDVVVNGVGETVISVKTEDSYRYNASETMVKVNVNKKNIGTISSEDIEWDNTQKIYDANNQISLTGHVKTEKGIVGSDRIDVTATATLDGKEVGNHHTTLSNVNITGSDKYSFTESFTSGPDVTINKKDAHLSIKDITVEYGSAEWKALSAGRFPTSLLDNLNIDEDIKDFLKRNGVENYLEATFAGGKYYVGSNANAITLSLKQSSVGNWNLILDDSSADINVTASTMNDQKIQSKIKVKDSDNSSIYKSGSTTYVRPGAEVEFEANDSEGLFDSVNVKQADGTYSSKLSIANDQATGDITNQFYLGNTNSPSTRSADTTIPDGLLKVDATLPTVNFDNGNFTDVKGNKISNSGVLEFNKFVGKDGYRLHVGVNDADSGVKNVEYKVIAAPSKDSQEADIVREAKASGWQTLPSDGNIEISGEREGTYIVLVKAIDNVGNEVVTTSNGIVVDTTPPVVNLVTARLQWNKTYEISIKDGPKYENSGIDHVVVTVKDNGVKLTSQEPRTNSFTLTKDELYSNDEKTVTKENISLGKKSNKIINIEGNISVDSNNVSIQVEAFDRAGNVIQTEEYKNIVVDKLDREMTITYLQNEPVNGKFFNQKRVMNITYRGRNFKENDVALLFQDSPTGAVQMFNLEDIRNGRVDGIRLKQDRIDSQADRNEETYTNERTNTYQFELGVDHGFMEFNKDKYIWSSSFLTGTGATNPDGVQYTEGTRAKTDFVIDTNKPKATMKLTGDNNEAIELSQDSENPYYTVNSVNAEISVEDFDGDFGGNFFGSDLGWTEKAKDRFDSSRVNIEVSVTNSSGETINYTQPVQGSWVTDGTTHKLNIGKFTSNGNYAIKATYQDEAGNKVELGKYYFTVDNTAPTGKIKVKQGDEEKDYYQAVEDIEKQSGLKKFIFNLFHMNDLHFVLNAADDISGVKSIEYTVVDAPSDASQTFNASTDFSKMNWSPVTEDVVISADRNSIIYQKITDKAGNITYISSNGGFIVDKANPNEPVVTVKQEQKEVYNSDIDVHVNISDPDNGGIGVFAGMKKLSYTVSSNGEVTQSGEFTNEEAKIRSVAGDIKIDASKNNSNNVVLHVTGEDYAGNKVEKDFVYKIDTTAPRIEISYDNQNVQNGKYYNAPRTATIKVYERNFDPSLANLKAVGYTSISDWKVGTDSSDENVNIATVTFANDTEATLDFSVDDKAGNHSEYGQVDRFTIDQTKPSISVAMSEGRYFNSTQTATITITEKNFNEASATAAVIATLNGQGIASPVLSGWSHNGDVHTATLTFDADGDYSFTLNAVDLAGNSAPTFSKEQFTIDKTIPTITFSGVEENSANRNIVQPVVTFSDTNFSSEKTVLTLKGQKHEEKTVSGSVVSSANGMQVTLPDFEHTEDNDDVYTLTATTTDMAGNTLTKSITFSVNRFGSTYKLSDSTEKFVNKAYHQKGDEIVLYEINPNNIVKQEVSILSDGKTTTLQANAYKFNKLEEQTWNKYEYRLPSSLFEKEGTYEIIVSSEDEAGNKQTNQIKKVNVKFVIDKTNPNAVITGIETGKLYNGSELNLGIDLTDNIKLGSAKLYLNDVEVQAYNEETVAKNNGKLAYTLHESDKWQTLKVVTVDAAGNEGTSEEMKVLVSSNWFTRFINGIWSKITIGIVAIISILLFFLFGKRRKKEEEE